MGIDTGRGGERLRRRAPSVDAPVAAHPHSSGSATDPFRTLVEHAGCGIARVGLDGRVLYVNPAWCSITGYNHDQALAHTLDDVTHPDDLATSKALMQGVMEGEASSYELDKRYARPDGSYVWIHLTASLVRRPTGEPDHFVAVIEVMSDRGQLEERLRFQASMLERTNDAIFLWELGGSIVFWNRGAELLYGYPAEEAVGQRSHDLLQTLLPQPAIAFEAHLLVEGEWKGELTHRTRDGRQVEVLSRLQVLRGNGEAVDKRIYVFETARDITERKRLEQRTHEALEALLAMAGALVSPAATDIPGAPAVDSTPPQDETLLPLAALCSQVLGCDQVAIVAADPQTERLRRSAITGATPEQVARWQAGLEDISLMQRFDADTLARLRAGETAVIEMESLAPQDPAHVLSRRRFLVAPMLAEGALAGYVGVHFGRKLGDYTAERVALTQAVARLVATVIERERLARDRAEAHARELALLAANQRMDEFLGIASHELRTPLTSITVNVQLAGRSLGAVTSAVSNDLPDTVVARLQRAHEMLERTGRQTGRLDRLVGDLLDVSRIQAGRLELRPEPCELSTIVREAVEEQRAAWPQRTIALEMTRRTTILLYADADRIGQVVTNLLTNALKYSAGDRPVHVCITTDDERARVDVRDQGPGLTAKQQAHLWERFYRVPGISHQSGSGVGLGLGLHICKTIVERHGGQVGVQSMSGEGSTFWFTLPLADRSVDRHVARR